MTEETKQKKAIRCVHGKDHMYGFVDSDETLIYATSNATGYYDTVACEKVMNEMPNGYHDVLVAIQLNNNQNPFMPVENEQGESEAKYMSNVLNWLLINQLTEELPTPEAVRDHFKTQLPGVTVGILKIYKPVGKTEPGDIDARFTVVFEHGEETLLDLVSKQWHDYEYGEPNNLDHMLVIPDMIAGIKTSGFRDQLCYFGIHYCKEFFKDTGEKGRNLVNPLDGDSDEETTAD